tara:strand:+ start:81 stop:635 length:555 start_codon:yes stop_codon:yes gene_type:complete
MIKKENTFCRLDNFSDGGSRDLNVKEWLDFCKECGSIKTEIDSSGREVLYRVIKNIDNAKIVRSTFLETISKLLGIICVFCLFEVIVCNASSKTNMFCLYRVEYYNLYAIFSGLVSLIINSFNNPEDFTFRDFHFEPGIKRYDGYYLDPICYVTFFENLEKSDSVEINYNFSKFRKQFYDYLNR